MDATRLTAQDYRKHLARDSARFAAVAVDLPPGTTVPTCPEWDGDDLLWHLTEVQWFWGELVATRPSGPEGIGPRPDRPADRDELVRLFRDVSDRLASELADVGPQAPVWTWSDDHTVAFVLRRQAQEAFVHRVDAEVAAGQRTPMDAALSADGVDEMLRVMLGGVPAWGAFAPATAQDVRLRCTDTGHSWRVTPGRFTGTSPGTGTDHDEPALDVADQDDGGPVAAEVSAAAADLDCALWHRPVVGDVSRTGDPEALAAFDAAAASGVE